jgi:hypothetical protein
MNAPAQHRGMLSKSVKATAGWKWAAVVLGAALVITAWQVLRMKTSQTVVLVPYGLYSANNQVKVSGSIQENKGYLELLFRADMEMLLNWQASNVQSQFATLMTRLSPAGYAAYNLDLRARAERYRDENMSQIFHVQNMSLLTNNDPNKYVMEAEGTLIRKRGSEEIINAKIVYRIEYSVKVNGLFQIDIIESSYEKASVREDSEA